MQEIHHRVKNNLQLVSSLLSLQSRSVEDEAATRALVEGQSRVQSMALIHKNLYNDNAASGLEVKDYVVQLTQQLLQTYGINPENVNNLGYDTSGGYPNGRTVTFGVSMDF